MLCVFFMFVCVCVCSCVRTLQLYQSSRGRTESETQGDLTMRLLTEAEVEQVLSPEGPSTGNSPSLLGTHTRTQTYSLLTFFFLSTNICVHAVLLHTQTCKHAHRKKKKQEMESSFCSDMEGEFIVGEHLVCLGAWVYVWSEHVCVCVT